MKTFDWLLLSLGKTDLECYEIYNKLLILKMMTESSLSNQLIKISVQSDLALCLGLNLSSNVSITLQMLA